MYGANETSLNLLEICHSIVYLHYQLPSQSTNHTIHILRSVKFYFAVVLTVTQKIHRKIPWIVFYGRFFRICSKISIIAIFLKEIHLIGRAQ